MNYCPHLGLVDDRSVVRGTPHGKNRCYAVQPADAPELGHQEQFCLSGEHVGCPRYRPADYMSAPTPPPSLPRFTVVEVEEFEDAPEGDGSFDDAAVGRDASSGRSAQDAGGRAGRSAVFSLRQWLPLAAWGLLAVVVAAAVMVYLADARAARRAAAAAAVGSAPSTTPLGGSAQGATTLASPAPSPSTTPLGGSAQGATTSASPAPSPSTTPLRGSAQGAITAQGATNGKTVALGVREGEAGWWSGGDERGNHLGDSFLYAGFANGEPFIAAARISLSGVARGAPIRAGEVRLTGLDAGRFDPNAGGTWSVQLLADATFPDFARTEFQALYNAPAAASLFPTFFAADLGVGEVNVAVLDEGARAWLEAQLIDGATAVIVRITGPAGGSDSVFAWDSGSGAKTVGEGPALVLDMGPAPTHTPPLPTEAVIVATWTPTPENVLTVAAQAWTATAIVETTGTPTPPTHRAVTPTPIPENAATAQALGIPGWRPIVISTLTPENGATATRQAEYATAVAATTGTFTPVPTNAVTPVVILPTPMPENVMTAAAQMSTATAQVAAMGTPTPLPFNAILATLTPEPFVIVDTPIPENAATRQAQAAYATAVAVTTGTFTPFPTNSVRATRTPAATAPPLVVYLDRLTPTRRPTPTQAIPGAMPRELASKILFVSDRGGAEAALFSLDPASGRLALVTQSWPYSLAQSKETRSSDGRFVVSVRIANTDLVNKITLVPYVVQSPQIFLKDAEFKTERQLTAGVSSNYDPVWSPSGGLIAFVSTEPGNDEIYTIRPDGSEMRRLTSNSWEWDKHPTWSPDGKQIVFWSNRETGRRQLWIMNADGSNQRRLMESASNDWDPIWVK